MGSHQKRVAVIGAGVSGVTSAKHLKERGLEVVVFERSRQAGGNWSVCLWGRGEDGGVWLMVAGPLMSGNRLSRVILQLHHPLRILLLRMERQRIRVTRKSYDLHLLGKFHLPYLNLERC
jgi:glycine/D-amino acid oxidase-like deaminating enzyme